jgi:hypothetical protein
METSPLSRQFGIRLDQLNQDIHRSLEQVRRHIQALEEVEQQAQTSRTESSQPNFADLLKESIEGAEPPVSPLR